MMMIRRQQKELMHHCKVATISLMMFGQSQYIVSAVFLELDAIINEVIKHTASHATHETLPARTAYKAQQTPPQNWGEPVQIGSQVDSRQHDNYKATVNSTSKTSIGSESYLATAISPLLPGSGPPMRTVNAHPVLCANRSKKRPRIDGQS